MSATPDAINILRQRGFVEQVTDEAVLTARMSSEQIVFYAGFDPTAPSLHIGHYIPLVAMAHLARAGHKAIALVGGGTAMVGDPSGKTEMRQLISAEQVVENRQAIELHIRGIIGESSTIVDNGEWLLPLNYIAFLRDIGRHFSVNRMLSAEAYRSRLEKGLSFIEFNYQLLQAYDFLALNERFNCTLQIGGDDQWGNILAGVDLIRRVRQKEAFGLTFPLLLTAAGTKMGKTAAGAVWLDPARTSPHDFYQYFVNVDDRDVVRFLKLLTFEPLEEIARFEALAGKELREAKRLLARAVTTIVHGAAVADGLESAARAAFGSGAISPPGTEISPAAGDALAASMAALPTIVVDGKRFAEGVKVVDLIAESGLAPSKSAARRLVEQGGVRVGERRITLIDDVLAAAEIEGDGCLLHVGKKHIRRLIRG